MVDEARGTDGQMASDLQLLLIGDSAVGKSSLLLRFTDNKFEETYRDTIGMDFRIKTVNLGSKVIKLQIWDTAGQEKFRTVTSSYYRGASGIICCYSVTDRRSFVNVRKWLRDIEAYASDDVLKLLVGNKVDMADARQVETSEGVALARSIGIPFMETSAKSGARVNDAFMMLASEIAKRDVEPEPIHDRIMLEDFSSLLPSKRKKCPCG